MDSAFNNLQRLIGNKTKTTRENFAQKILLWKGFSQVDVDMSFNTGFPGKSNFTDFTIKRFFTNVC